MGVRLRDTEEEIRQDERDKLVDMLEEMKERNIATTLKEVINEALDQAIQKIKEM